MGNARGSERNIAAAVAKELDVYRPALRGYFRRRVSAATAEDLIQEVFVAMLHRKHDTQVLNLGGYLFVVASRILQRHHSREHREIYPELLQHHDHASDEPSPERLLLSREDLRRALGIIDDLPLRTREIFVLHRFEEMSYSAIASRFGVTVSAVEKHISTALRALAVLRKGRP